ncbi:hypothetical protein [Pseudomonas proteolytica]|uniref:hypothetical protein n=1 Tax=Pseudomonas proteolytica TaxID=219574 RepID=UPI0012BA2D79|nr:hypothetical protein [Pseudomonas proteolytica]NMY96147.1 hypothetical protein [Pseudomonas proteolytica]
MIKDSPNPPLDSSALHASAHRAINHYLNPPPKSQPPTDGYGLFTVREGLDAETLLANGGSYPASGE